jgi:isopentenyl-diphosphate delta-isomerase
MSEEEQIVEVDKDDTIIGVRAKREFRNSEHIHRSVALLLFNSKGEVAVQHRVTNKKLYPGMDEFSVSGTLAQESYDECMEREVKEELGISPTLTPLFKYFHSDDHDKAWKMVYIATSDEELTLQEEEVESVTWWRPEALLADMETHPEKYVPPFIQGFKKYMEEHH